MSQQVLSLMGIWGKYCLAYLGIIFSLRQRSLVGEEETEVCLALKRHLGYQYGGSHTISVPLELVITELMYHHRLRYNCSMWCHEWTTNRYRRSYSLWHLHNLPVHSVFDSIVSFEFVSTVTELEVNDWLRVSDWANRMTWVSQWVGDCESHSVTVNDETSVKSVFANTEWLLSKLVLSWLTSSNLSFTLSVWSSHFLRTWDWSWLNE